MHLDGIDWNHLTKREAVALRNAARRREKEVGIRFEADQATEAEFTAACRLEEDLHVFIVTGLTPDQCEASK